jgi:hypothetical protein
MESNSQCTLPGIGGETRATGLYGRPKVGSFMRQSNFVLWDENDFRWGGPPGGISGGLSGFGMTVELKVVIIRCFVCSAMVNGRE